MIRSLPSEYTPFALPKLRTSPKLHWEMNIDWKTNSRRRPALNWVWAPGIPKSASVRCGTFVARLALHWPEYLRDWLLEEEKGKQLPACRLCCLCVQIRHRSLEELRFWISFSTGPGFAVGDWVCSCRKEARETGDLNYSLSFCKLIQVTFYYLY